MRSPYLRPHMDSMSTKIHGRLCTHAPYDLYSAYEVRLLFKGSSYLFVHTLYMCGYYSRVAAIRGVAAIWVNMVCCSYHSNWLYHMPDGTCQSCRLTMVCRSMMYTSLLHPADKPPPNSTAMCRSIMVRDVPESGGGLVPVVGGELHRPAEDSQWHT